MSRDGRGGLWWRQLHLALPLGAETATQVAERLVVDAHLGHLVLEARAASGRVRYLLGAVADHGLDDIICQLAPGSRTTSPTESRGPVKVALRLGVRRASLPLSSERLEAVARAVLAAMATTGGDEELVIQIHIGRRYQPALATGETPPAGWLELLGLRTPPAGSETVRRHRAHAAQHRAGVGVRLGVTAATPARRRLLLQNLLGALRVAESAGVRLHAHPEAPDRLNQAPSPVALSANLERGGDFVPERLAGRAGRPARHSRSSPQAPATARGAGPHACLRHRHPGAERSASGDQHRGRTVAHRAARTNWVG